MKRINSIDFTRGLVMIIMALDHTRDLMHVSSLTQSPTDLLTTTPTLFFTRIITHLCAPTFVFLSGVSVYLSLKATNNIAESKRFLLSRGLWLIFLEFTVISLGLWADIHFGVLLFNVIAAIGFGFIVLSFLLKISPKTLGITGLIIIFCHNLLPLIPFEKGSITQNILTPFFSSTAFPITPKTLFVMGYPPIPWLGVMLTGFSAGQLFEISEMKRKVLFLKIGLVSLALFLVIRFINIYGDPVVWSSQKDGLFTIMSFLNVTKYPPSLLFCLLTLGCMFLIMSILEGAKNQLTDILSVYGKVPLFYFIVHWYIIHIMMFGMVFLQGYKPTDLVFGFNFGRPKTGSGVELLAIYFLWICVVLIMFPLCKWYGKYKANHREKLWLRYL
jgi:uncharacterized membrane protein